MARFDEKSRSSELTRSVPLFCYMSIFNFLVNDIIDISSVNAESIFGIGSVYESEPLFKCEIDISFFF